MKQRKTRLYADTLVLVIDWMYSDTKRECMDVGALLRELID